MNVRNIFWQANMSEHDEKNYSKRMNYFSTLQKHRGNQKCTGTPHIQKLRRSPSRKTLKRRTYQEKVWSPAPRAEFHNRMMHGIHLFTSSVKQTKKERKIEQCINGVFSKTEGNKHQP